MSAPVSPQGLAVVRGRGYRPDEVDRYLARLSVSRDDAWERAARLTVLAKQMEAEAVRLREVVATLAPQTYDDLGERARRILDLAQEEAAAVCAAAADDADAMREAAEVAGRKAADTAREWAESARADADAYARQLLLGAQHDAEETRRAARREVKDSRDAALTALKKMRQEAADVLAGVEEDQARRWDAAEREYADRAAELDAKHVELEAYAEGMLMEAQRAFTEAEETARHGQEDAEAQGAELLAQARARADRLARDTERVLREHAEAEEEMRAHMENINSSLAALTGRAAAEG
ncbi:cellulose-binding protein [Streptomyces sp. NPDC051219]|uniref:cellulose-binding protein n=1 Tax=Streptomyces sp. NPDC051219 TaxID=3155283 RepID=UPI00341B4219